MNAGPADASDPYKLFIADLQSLVGKLGARRVREFAGLYGGNGMKAASESSIYKLINDGQKLNDGDMEMLRRFVYESEVGQLARGKRPADRDPGAYLMSAFRAYDASKEAVAPFDGHYFCRHWSYRYDECYVVRVLNFRPTRDGIAVDDYLRDTQKNENEPPLLKAQGMVAFHNSEATLLLRRSDNAVRFNMITISNTEPAVGQFMTGQMSGINHGDVHFFRSVILHKAKGSLNDAIQRTGIFKMENPPNDPTGTAVALRDMVDSMPKISIHDKIRDYILN